MNASLTWGVLFLVIVPVVLAMVVGVIVLLVRGGSVVRWTIGTILVVLLLLALPLMLLMSWDSVDHAQTVAHAQRQEIEQRAAAIEAYNQREQERRREAHAHGGDSSIVTQGEQVLEVHEEAHGGSGGRETWRHAADHFLVADHYPSAAAAARGLAVEIEPLLASVAPAGGEATEVVIVTTAGVDPSVGQAMADVLRERDPKRRVTLNSGEADATPIRIVLELGGRYQLVAGKNVAEGHMLSAKATGPGGTQTRQAPFVNKPWVQDFNAFVSTWNDGDYLLGQSMQPALHAGEAQAMAIADAAQQITVRAQARLLGEARYGSINSTRLHQQIVIALNEGRFIEDRFVQAFERPGGKVYQAWLLIKPDPGVLDEMAREQFTAAAHQRQRYFSSAGGAVVMLIVVLVLYAFLNAATKGYYALGLKLAAAAVVVVGAVWLVLIT